MGSKVNGTFRSIIDTFKEQESYEQLTSAEQMMVSGAFEFLLDMSTRVGTIETYVKERESKDKRFAMLITALVTVVVALVNGGFLWLAS